MNPALTILPQTFEYGGFYGLEFDARIAANDSDVVRPLAFLDEGSAVFFRLKLQRGTAPSTMEEAREKVGSVSGMLGLNAMPFQEIDDLQVFLRGLHRRVCVFDDDPIFSGDHFEGCSLPLLVQSTVGFAIHHAAQVDLVDNQPIQYAVRPACSFRRGDTATVEFCADRAAGFTA